MPRFVILLSIEQESNTWTSMEFHGRSSTLEVCSINGFVSTLQAAFNECSHKYSSGAPDTSILGMRGSQSK